MANRSQKNHQNRPDVTLPRRQAQDEPLPGTRLPGPGKTPGQAEGDEETERVNLNLGEPDQS